MPLPKLVAPTHEVVIPSTGEKLTIRPFLVKEEKILLMALSGDDIEEMTRAVKQIITNCVISPQPFDIDKLAIFDLEYLFLQLRIRSIGETTQIRFQPIEGSTCPECSKPRTVTVDLAQAVIEKNPDHSDKIQITENVGLKMKYPQTLAVLDLEKVQQQNDVDALFRVITSCIEYIYDQESVYPIKDARSDEVREFLESLNPEQFAKIETFFLTIPKLKQTIHVKCSKCDFESDYDLVGLESFFG